MQIPRVPSDQIAPGDLILSDGLEHVGMYIGSSQDIRAPHSGDIAENTALARHIGSALGAIRPEAALPATLSSSMVIEMWIQHDQLTQTPA